MPKSVRPKSAFLDRCVTMTLTDNEHPDHAYVLCVVPHEDYPVVSKAFDILAGVKEDRDLWGLTVRFGQAIFVVVPDTVEVRTIAHEAVHVAVEFGITAAQEEDFALVVGHMVGDMDLAITELRSTCTKPATTKLKR